MFLANKLNKGAGAPPATTDPQFNYVTMLLHGDGTNGAQNNTFLDSSTNNFTITRNGNTTQGSFSPYGSNWSNNFNGTNAYLTLANNTNWVLGTSYTIEAWVNFSDIVDQDIICGSNSRWWLSRSLTDTGVTAGKFGFSALVGTWSSISSTTTPVAGVWYHVAATISSGTVSLYVNGVREATGSLSIPTDNIDLLDIATWNGGVSTYGINGYISNLRLVKGSVIYTGTSFTVPTAPLTAVTNTVLLTCQSNRFIDNSTNAYAITANGTPSVQRFNPFGASTAYSTSVIGGSGYFDGTGDYLSTPNSSSFAFGTGNFTVEFWYRGTDTGGGFGLTTGGSTGYWQLNLSGSTMYWQNDVGVSNLLSVSASPILNDAWNHVAVVRNSTTLTIYFNGVSVTSTSDTTNYSGTGGNFQLGFDSNSNYIAGYIADYRIVKGTAVYTANFTPPTAPLTAITNTSLLLSMTNGAIFDNAMMNDLETVGDAQISTSVVKYGTGSLAFDGTGDILKSPDSLSLAFGSGNFTVEGWINLNSVASPTKGIIFGLSENAFGLRVGQGYLGSRNGLNIVRAGVADLEYCVFTFAINTWYHIAVVRSGTTIYFFVDGVQQTTQGSGASSYNYPASPAGLYVGANNDGNENFNGYIDDLRITKGYARYTANFTPPTAAFPNIGPV
jgi:hypothetical protein